MDWRKIILTKDNALEVKKGVDRIVSKGIYSIETVNGNFDPLDNDLVYLNKYVSKEDQILAPPIKYPNDPVAFIFLVRKKKDPFLNDKFLLMSFGSFEKGSEFYFRENEVRIKKDHLFCQRIIRIKMLYEGPYTKEQLSLVEKSFAKEKEHDYKVPKGSGDDFEWEPAC